MSIHGKSEQLAHSLREKILSGEYPLGASLPSTSLLCDGYGVSKTTARQAVERLKSEGLVCGRHGRGVEVIRRLEDEPRREGDLLPVLVVLEYTLWDNPFFYRLVALFQQFYGSRVQLHTQFVFPAKLNEVGIPSDRLILLGGRFPEDVLRSFLASHPKAILLNWILEGANYVSPDEVQAGKIAAQALVNAGKRRIGLLCITYHFYLNKVLGDEFELRLKGARNYLSTLPDAPGFVNVSADDWDCLEPGDKILGRLLEKEHGIDALVVPFDRLAVNLLDVLNRLHIQVPRQIAIISFDDNFFSQFCQPPLTSVALQMSDYLQKLWKGLHAVMRGRPYQAKVKPTIVLRGSL